MSDSKKLVLEAGLLEKLPRTSTGPSASRPISIDEHTLNEGNEILKEEREATRAAISDPECKEDEFPGDVG